MTKYVVKETTTQMVHGRKVLSVSYIGKDSELKLIYTDFLKSFTKPTDEEIRLWISDYGYSRLSDCNKQKTRQANMDNDLIAIYNLYAEFTVDIISIEV